MVWMEGQTLESKNGERRSPLWVSLVSAFDARVGQVALELGPEAVHEAAMATHVGKKDAGIVQDVCRAIGSDSELWSDHVADIGPSKNFSFGRDGLQITVGGDEDSAITGENRRGGDGNADFGVPLLGAAGIEGVEMAV